MDRMADVFPKDLVLGDFCGGRSVPILMKRTHQIGSIFFSGAIGAEIFATPDLFTRCFDKLVPSYFNEVVFRTPASGFAFDFVEKWWKGVLDVPVLIGLDHEIRIETEDLIGCGSLYRGLLLCFSCFSVDPPPAKPFWKTFRKEHPDLRSTIGD